MTDSTDNAPERVCDWCDETSLKRKARCPVKGCHTRAQATDAQVMSHPKVAALVEAAHPIAFWTIGNMLADDPEVVAEYPHLSEAILSLRAALAALTTGDKTDG